MRDNENSLYQISKSWPSQLSEKEIEKYFNEPNKYLLDKIKISCLKLIVQKAYNTTCIYNEDYEDIFNDVYLNLGRMINGFNRNFNNDDKRPIDQRFYSFISRCIKNEIHAVYDKKNAIYRKHFIETTLETAVCIEENGNEITLGDKIVDNHIDMDSILNKKMTKDKINKSLDMLSKEEEYIIKSLFGFKDEKKSEKEIGLELGKTQKQISRMKESILLKLKKYLMYQGINEETYFLDNDISKIRKYRK